MQLSARTLQILKNFSSINQSIVFRKGNEISTISPMKTIMARATIPEDIPVDFGIYDLSRFINTMSLFSEPDIEPSDKFVKISGKGSATSKYTCTDVNNIVTPPAKKINMPSVDVQFDLDWDNFSKIVKALGILGLPEFSVVGDRETVSIQAIDSKNPTSDVFSIPLGETKSQFNMVFKAENLKILQDDYKVDISSKGLAKFAGNNVEYFIAVESTSKFEV